MNHTKNDLLSYLLVDLTHCLSPEIPSWGGSCGFCLEIKKDYDRQFRVQQIKMHAGIGTHMDAPSHRISGAACVADIPLAQCVVPACVIDVAAQGSATYKVPLEEVMKYEARYGTIPKNALVIFHTGWGRFWSTPEAYRNVDAEGIMHFPSIAAEVADFLLTRQIAGIAIDTLSPDSLSGDFPVHQILLGAGKYIIENIASAEKMPPQGGYVIALPLRAQEATEAPARVIGLIPSWAHN